MITASSSTNLASLVAAADAASASGDRARAIHAWQGVLAADPNNTRALNVIGNAMLHAGDAPGSRAYLERAVEGEPAQPAIWYNLALACTAAADALGALDALNRALALDPYFVQALFERGRVLEGLGRLPAAAASFKAYLDCAGPQVQADPRLAMPMEHARSVIGRNAEKLAGQVEVKLGPEAASTLSARISEGLNAYLGRQPVYLQQPTFFTVPRLPAEPFFERSMFAWIEELEQATTVVLGELRDLVAHQSSADFAPYVARPPGLPVNQWGELNHSPRWGAFHLFNEGRKIEENCARCPQTTALLEGMPLNRIEGYSPNAFFSLLKPNTRIPAHTGVTNARATVHLGLSTPEDCGFRVGAEVREWRSGRAWVFDDSIEHEAWNNSGADRIILIFDIWNPYLSDTECSQIASIFESIDQHNGSSAAKDSH